MTDMTTTMVVPRFRSTARLLAWVSRWNRHTRLPEVSEKCFFNDKDSPQTKATAAARYADYVGPLDSNFEELIRHDPRAIVSYSKVLATKGMVLPTLLEEEVKKYNSYLYDYALVRLNWPDLYPTKRLPQHLEDCITDVNVGIKYAKTVIKGRLPKEMEMRLFGQEMTAEARARLVANYAENVGPLDSTLEEMLEGQADPLFSYFAVLSRANTNELPSRLVDSLAGNDLALIKFARTYRRRLPKHLESGLSVPQICYQYAKDILKGRLPESVEMAFLKDHHYAAKYAFDVIRGFASVKLPGELHSLMLMKSFENPNDMEIKEYISACEGPEKTQ